MTLPVRHGKSHCVNLWFALAYLLAHPDHQIILCTASASLALHFSGQVRDLFHQVGPRLVGHSVHPAAHSAEFWRIAGPTGARTGGGMQAAGVGGQINGFGAHLLLLDDLTRNFEHAASPAYRDSVWRWMNSTAFTRLEPGAPVVSIGTPWHSDDHFGRLRLAEEEGGDAWTRVRLPALAEEDDPLGRAPGEALWPERYSRQALERIRDDLFAKGLAADWHALYQCKPLAGGGLTEWPDSYTEGLRVPGLPPDAEVVFRVLSLDPSKGKDAKHGDYSAWSDVYFTRDGHLYIRPTMLIIPTNQIEDHTIALIEQAAAEKPYNGVVIETNFGQEQLLTNVKAKLEKKGLFAPLYSHANCLNKIVRIRVSLTPLLAQRRVHILPSPHARLYVNQFKEFPSGAHDDAPDSLEIASQLLNFFLTGKRMSTDLVLKV